ncbi:MAG: QueG-associated DUF1730 domain-containing protein [Acholeplasmataceae bacterium]|jgi:epoxyqueuosine reductase|nr:DUF1730 domain-containing protein [Acholeplasmataceae bacterium]
MTAQQLYHLFSKSFDIVAMIETKTYLEEAKKLNRKITSETYPTMVVLGLSYPYRPMKHTKTHLAPSFYTFGKDYHLILKNRIKEVMDNLQIAYHFGVDNHPHDERLAATLSGIGFMGKNQLIINKNFGSYFFLGIVFLDMVLDKEIRLEVTDDCGSCRKCIDACPTQALEEGQYHMEKCISHFNQSKRELTDTEIQKNHSLFGCDICQRVCPKNINKGLVVHPEFQLSGKEMVSIVELFQDSDKVYKSKYQDMAYMWKGKTLLMRNALTLLMRQKNTEYNELIRSSLERLTVPWYYKTASHILEQLDQIKSSEK